MKGSMSIETLGKLVLVVLVVVGIILFVIHGISVQAGNYNQTSGSIISNLSQKAEEAKGSIVIS